MKYKVADKVICRVKNKDGFKRIQLSAPSEEKTEKITCKVLRVYKLYPEAPSDQLMILLPDDVVGWMISQFHVANFGVGEHLIGKKFYELSENDVESAVKDK